MTREYSHTKAIKEAKIRENNSCQACGSNEKLNGHHMKDYAFGGPADPDYIIVLCRDCHKKAHRGQISIDFFDYRE